MNGRKHIRRLRSSAFVSLFKENSKIYVVSGSYPRQKKTYHHPRSSLIFHFFIEGKLVYSGVWYVWFWNWISLTITFSFSTSKTIHTIHHHTPKIDYSINRYWKVIFYMVYGLKNHQKTIHQLYTRLHVL